MSKRDRRQTIITQCDCVLLFKQLNISNSIATAVITPTILSHILCANAVYDNRCVINQHASDCIEVIPCTSFVQLP